MRYNKATQGMTCPWFLGDFCNTAGVRSVIVHLHDDHSDGHFCEAGGPQCVYTLYTLKFSTPMGRRNFMRRTAKVGCVSALAEAGIKPTRVAMTPA